MAVRDALRVGYRRIIVPHVPLPLWRRWLYRRNHGRWPNLGQPQSFTEKVNWRIIHDRRELLSGTCDKQWMKDYATKAGARVPTTLWMGTDLTELLQAALPQRWVLKPNHRSGLVHFGDGKPDVEVLKRVTEGWLEPFQSVELREWAYSMAKPALLVEERIGGDEPPEDYKLFVFDGVPRIVQVDSGRFGEHRRRLYRPDWTPLSVQNRKPLGEITPAPHALEAMLEMGSLLGRPFDFMRIDLYLIGSDVYFGETTPYPAGGLDWYRPRDLDEQMGEWWRLPVLSDSDGSSVSTRAG